jgi:hypothetical protein
MTSSWRGCGDCDGVCGTDSRTHHLIKAWPTTTRAGPRAFANNADTEARASSCQSPTGASAPVLMALRVAASDQSAPGLVTSNLAHYDAGPWSTRDDTRDVRPHRADASITQIWWPDGSHRTCRSGWVVLLKRAQLTHRSDHFECGRTRWIVLVLLEMP